MRISDWSSDVCFRSSFAAPVVVDEGEAVQGRPDVALDDKQAWVAWLREDASGQSLWLARYAPDLSRELSRTQVAALQGRGRGRSEEHTSELQSLMRISYAVFCLKKKKQSAKKIKKQTNKIYMQK